MEIQNLIEECWSEFVATKWEKLDTISFILYFRFFSYNSLNWYEGLKNEFFVLGKREITGK